MASLGDVGTAIRAALDLVKRVRAALWTAAENAEEARDLLRTHGAGTGDREWDQAAVSFDSAASGADALRNNAAAAEAFAESLLKLLGLDVTTTGTTSSPPTPPAHPQSPQPPNAVPPGSPAHIEQLRRGLPPRVQPGSGEKTHGRWFTATEPSKVGALVSGRDDWSGEAAARLARAGVRGVPVAVSDVELKLAAHMAREGITDATVIINFAPCKGDLSCDTLIPVLLPEGSRLTVHGQTRQGMIMRKTYTGGASWT